nr:unnamed protein product [Callosobruchus analis]
MSQLKPSVPDVSRQKADDKGSLYESSTTDSGFLSGEITEETSDSADLMLVSSGVCLSENFSKISISDEKNSLNNLDAPKRQSVNRNHLLRGRDKVWTKCCGKFITSRMKTVIHIFTWQLPTVSRRWPSR